VAGTTDRPPYYDPAAWPDIRAAMAEKGFWPLYQDAHIHQYVLEFKPIIRWVSLDACQRKYRRQPDEGARLVIRRPCRSTDERTCIAALLPERSCFGDTLTGVAVAPGAAPILLALLNSFAFDFLARKRVAGRDVRPFQLKPIAAPTPERLAEQLSPPQCIHVNASQAWVYDRRDLWSELWNAEKAVAGSYDLAPDELLVILQDFDVSARKRPAFHTYLLARLAEWREEAGEVAGPSFTYRESGQPVKKVAES
jgi:hypothetical protein